MKTINSFMPYIYGLLIIVLIGTLIAFLIRLSKTMKKIAQTADVAKGIGNNLQKTTDSLDQIKASSDSWSFFAALLGVVFIVKETFKYYRSEKSLPKSFTKAVIRHSGQIKNLNFRP